MNAQLLPGCRQTRLKDTRRADAANRDGEEPLKVLLHMWQQWGRPSSCFLALWRTRAPFSVKRCSQTSQANGRSPVCVRLCLSRLAGFSRRDRGAVRTAPAHTASLFQHRYLASGRSFRRGGTDTASRRCGCAGGCLGCFSGRRRGHTSCTQKAARFWGQKRKKPQRASAVCLEVR